VRTSGVNGTGGAGGDNSVIGDARPVLGRNPGNTGVSEAMGTGPGTLISTGPGATQASQSGTNSIEVGENGDVGSGIFGPARMLAQNSANLTVSDELMAVADAVVLIGGNAQTSSIAGQLAPECRQLHRRRGRAVQTERLERGARRQHHRLTGPSGRSRAPTCPRRRAGPSSPRPSRRARRPAGPERSSPRRRVRLQPPWDPTMRRPVYPRPPSSDRRPGAVVARSTRIPAPQPRTFVTIRTRTVGRDRRNRV